MSQALLSDPAHWRDRAEGARRIAEEMPDVGAKQVMLDIAASYDRLAERAVQRLNVDVK